MTRNVNDFFRDKTAIITGGASGIGKALAIALASRGCTVVIADRQVAIAQQLAEEIASRGGRARAAEVDVRNRAAMQTLVAETIARTNRLDFFFNNAGIAIGGPIHEYDEDDWDQTFAVNIKGTTNGIDAAYPVMREQGFGHIINTSSAAGLFPSAVSTGYSASKFAVTCLSLCLRVEAKEFGISVCTLCPGVIQTPILQGGQYGRIAKGTSPEKLERYWKKFAPMSADTFAELALRDIARNKAVIIVPRWWALWAWAYRLSIPLWLRYSASMHLRQSARPGVPQPAQQGGKVKAHEPL